MPEQRQYVTVQGKRYPLKTESERAASKQNSTPEGTESVPRSTSMDKRVSVPVPRSGNRTVTLALLVAFGTYALAGKEGLSKLTRVQNYLTPQGATSSAQLALAQEGASAEGAGGGGRGIGEGSVFAPRALFAWMFLFVILQVLADFDTTSELAGALATLIMFTSLIALGPTALSNVTSLV